MLKEYINSFFYLRIVIFTVFNWCKLSCIIFILDSKKLLSVFDAPFIFNNKNLTLFKQINLQKIYMFNKTNKV